VSVGSPSQGLIFDTSAIIGLTEGGSSQLVDIVKQPGQPITRSITVDGELRHGAATVSNTSGHDRSRTLVRYEELSAWSELEVWLAEVGRMCGEVSVIADVNGLKVGMNDRAWTQLSMS
jgi:hypothetical protein